MATTILPADGEAAALVPARGSVTWRLSADARVLAGAGYALLLQVAHPVVGAGVADHSDFRSDPWGRLWRTLDHVSVSVFGGPRAAQAMGRRTRELHKGMEGVRPDGQRYHALEPDAYAWVHATLAHATLRAHDVFGTPVTPRAREVFYAEWRRVGRLVGVRERDLPEDAGAFDAYVAAMVRDVLEDNGTVQDVLASIARPAPPDLPVLRTPVWRLLRLPAAAGVGVVTRGLLGRELRERFGVGWTRGDGAAFAALAAASRAATPVLPRAVREFGPLYLACRREAIRAGGIPV